MSFISRNLGKIINKADIIVSKNKLLNSQWLKITDGGDRITYAFLNDKRLVISKNGNGYEGKWEFIVDNYTLIIETESLEIFNCNFINDEFLIINKDNTNQIQVFGNLSKFKNISTPDVQYSFNRLFSYINLNNNLHHDERLYMIQVYELKSLLETGADKNRATQIVKELVQDAESGLKFRSKYKEIIGTDITSHLINSRFKADDTKNIISPLLNFGIIRAK